MENMDEVIDTANRILNSHTSGDVVIVVGECTASYEGRAWKYLGEGMRSVQINPDQSVQVHSPKSIEPAVWQPGSAETKVSVVDGDIVVRSERNNPDEVVTIEFKRIVEHLTYSPSRDYPEVEGSEDDIHRYIMENPECISDDFDPLVNEKETGFGRIDVFGKEGETPVVVEVKRKTASMDAVDQLNRYVTSEKGEEGKDVRGVLAAPSATTKAMSLLDKHGYQFVEVNPVDALSDS